MRRVRGAHKPRPSYGQILAFARPSGTAASRCGPCCCSCAVLPGTYSSALALAKFEEGKKRLKKMAAAPLRPARFLFLFLPRPLPLARTKAQKKKRGKEASMPSKGRNRRGEVKGEGSLDEYLYFPFCGRCDFLETKVRKDSSLPARQGYLVQSTFFFLPRPLSRA